MRETVFATVNGKDILGLDIINTRKRIENENTEESGFAYIPNEENNSYLNAEALMQIIVRQCLLALAKFEGVEVSDEDISKAVYELRDGYGDEAEWISALDDLGLDDKNIREVFYQDMMIEGLLESHLEHFEAPDNNKAAEFYKQNIDSMNLPSKYTFLEIEVKDSSQLKTAAEILSKGDTAYVLSEAEKYGLIFITLTFFFTAESL